MRPAVINLGIKGAVLVFREPPSCNLPAPPDEPEELIVELIPVSILTGSSTSAGWTSCVATYGSRRDTYRDRRRYAYRNVLGQYELVAFTITDSTLVQFVFDVGLVGGVIRFRVRATKRSVAHAATVRIKGLLRGCAPK